MDSDASREEGHLQHDPETDCLRDEGGETGATDSHPESEDENRVQNDVQQGSGEYADHRQGSVSLKPHLVVEHETSRDERGSEQDVDEIRTSVRENCPGGAHRHQHGIAEQKPQDGCHGNHGHRIYQPADGHGCGISRLPRSQLAGDVVPGTVTEEEGDSLNQGHEREHDSERGRGLGVGLPDKEGVG